MSAKDGSNVKEMFDDVISKLMESGGVVVGGKVKPRESEKSSSSGSRLSYDYNQ